MRKKFHIFFDFVIDYNLLVISVITLILSLMWLGHYLQKGGESRFLDSQISLMLALLPVLTTLTFFLFNRLFDDIKNRNYQFLLIHSLKKEVSIIMNNTHGIGYWNYYMIDISRYLTNINSEINHKSTRELKNKIILVTEKTKLVNNYLDMIRHRISMYPISNEQIDYYKTRDPIINELLEKIGQVNSEDGGLNDRLKNLECEIEKLLDN